MKCYFSWLYYVAIYIFLSASIWGANTDQPEENSDEETQNSSTYRRLSSMFFRTDTNRLELLTLSDMRKLLKNEKNPKTNREFFPCERERFNKYWAAYKVGRDNHIRDPRKKDIIDLAEQYFNNDINNDGRILLERWFKFDHADKFFKDHQSSEVSQGILNWHLGPVKNKPDDSMQKVNYRLLTYPVYQNGQLVYDEDKVKVNSILLIELNGTGYYRGSDGIDEKLNFFDWDWKKYGHPTLLDVLSYLQKEEGLHPSPFKKPIQIYDSHPLFTRDPQRKLMQWELDRKENCINALKAARYYFFTPTHEELVKIYDEYVNDPSSMSQEGLDFLTEGLNFSHLDEWLKLNKHERNDLHTGKIKWFLVPASSGTEVYNSEGKLVRSRMFNFLVHDKDNKPKLVDSKYLIGKVFITYVAGMGYILTSEMPNDIEDYLNWPGNRQASLLSLLHNTQSKGLRFLSLQPDEKKCPGFFNSRNRKEAYKLHLEKALKETLMAQSRLAINTKFNDDIITILVKPMLDKNANPLVLSGVNRAYRINEAYEYYVKNNQKDQPKKSKSKLKGFERERVENFYKYYDLKQKREAEKNDDELRQLWQEYLSNPQEFNPDAPGISEAKKQEAQRKRTILNVKMESDSDVIIFFELKRDLSKNNVDDVSQRIAKEPIGTWSLQPSSARSRGDISYLTFVYKDKTSVVKVRITLHRGYGWLLGDGKEKFSSFLDTIDYLRKNCGFAKYLK